MVRMVVVWWAGKVAGVAGFDGVRWADYGDSPEETERLAVDWFNLGQGLRANGFFSFDRHSMTKGAGVNFRMCEAWVVDVETGKTVERKGVGL